MLLSPYSLLSSIALMRQALDHPLHLQVVEEDELAAMNIAQPPQSTNTGPCCYTANTGPCCYTANTGPCCYTGSQ